MPVNQMIIFFLISTILCHVIGPPPAATAVWKTKKITQDDEIIPINAVPGRTVELPCALNPDAPTDKMYVVLWFRHVSTKPVYRNQDSFAEEIEECDSITILFKKYYDFANLTFTDKVYSNTENQLLGRFATDTEDWKYLRTDAFDLRGRSPQSARDWSASNSADYQFIYNSSSQHITNRLLIKNVNFDHMGMYRCRVDYKESPSRSAYVKLSLVVPPYYMAMYDSFHKDLAGVIGPINEGDNVTVYCEVQGGHPQPSIVWDANDTNHTITTIKNDGIVRVSQLVLKNVDRHYDNTVIKCRAKSSYSKHANLIVDPIPAPERSAILIMNLKPFNLSIELEGAHGGNVGAGTFLKFICVSIGSKPPAAIQWFNGTQEIFTNQIYLLGRSTISTTAVNEDIYSTISNLSFEALPQDNGISIQCHSSNPILMSSTIIRSMTLHVHFRPIVTLVSGVLPERSMVKEGVAAYFDCIIEAYPKETFLKFLKDGEVILKSGKVRWFSGNSLVLQNLSRADTGDYSCMAANTIGNTTSKSVSLVVHYVPECDQPSPLIIGAHLRDTFDVQCKVRSELPKTVTITWSFTNSSIKRKSQGIKGIMPYSIASERDFGSVMCRARNLIGVQKKPCEIRIVPSGQGRPPSNCTVHFPGYNDHAGVLCYPSIITVTPQIFTLEALTFPYKRVVLSSAEGISDHKVWLNFSISKLDGLRPNDTLWVYVSNKEGRSLPYDLRATVMDFVKPKAPKPDPPPELDQGPITALILIVIAVATAVVIWFRFVRNARCAGPTRTWPDFCNRSQSDTYDTDQNIVNRHAIEMVVQAIDTGVSSIIARDPEETGLQNEQRCSEGNELTNRRAYVETRRHISCTVWSRATRHTAATAAHLRVTRDRTPAMAAQTTTVAARTPATATHALARTDPELYTRLPPTRGHGRDRVSIV